MSTDWNSMNLISQSAIELHQESVMFVKASGLSHSEKP